MKIELDPFKENGSAIKPNHPAASQKVFSIRWLGGDTEHFTEGDQTDAYTDENGTTYGMSLNGSWIPVGKEGVDWEWVRYNPVKNNPRDYGEDMAYRAGRSGYSPEPSFRAIWENDDQDGFVGGQEFLADEVYDRRSDTYLYYGFPTEDSAPVEITAADFQYVGPIKRKGRSAYVEKPVKKNGRRAKLPRNHYFVYTRGGALVAGPISKDGAVSRTHHDGGLVYYVAQNTVQFEELKRGMIPPGLYASSAKPNGFKHARSSGGQKWHVHFEDEKGVLYYITRTRDKDHRIQLSRSANDAKMFTAQRAAQLAKRLQRLYKDINGGSGRFFAETEAKANGDLGGFHQDLMSDVRSRAANSLRSDYSPGDVLVTPRGAKVTFIGDLPEDKNKRRRVYVQFPDGHRSSAYLDMLTPSDE